MKSPTQTSNPKVQNTRLLTLKTLDNAFEYKFTPDEVKYVEECLIIIVIIIITLTCSYN